MKPKFKVGDKIKVVDQGKERYGHITLIMNPYLPEERRYYTSMYPCALPNYIYIDCVDYKFGKKSVISALNIFKEDQLEAVSDSEFKNKTKL